MPGAGMGYVLAGSLLIPLSAIWVLNRLEWPTRAVKYVVLAAAALSICGCIININYFTAAFGATEAQPLLENLDSRRDWSWACHIAFGDQAPDSMPGGMSFITAALLSLFGRSVAVPVLFDSFCYVMALIVMGTVAWRVTTDRRVANITVVIAATMCYLFVQGTLLIKDAPVTFLFAVIVARLLAWRERPQLSVGSVVTFIFVLAVLGILRHNIMPMVALVSLLLAVRAPRRAALTLALAALAAMLWRMVVDSCIMPVPTSMVRVLSAEKDAMVVLSNPYTAPWDSLTGDYTTLSFWQKLLWLPASLTLQFLLPFPWNFGRDMIFGPVEAVAHFGFTWYIAGALVLYWLASRFKKSSSAMQYTVLAGVIFTIITAYLSSGRVSRYCLPYLPLLLPAAAEVLVYCRHRRSLKVWLGIFAVFLTSGLVYCYYLQSNL